MDTVFQNVRTYCIVLLGCCLASLPIDAQVRFLERGLQPQSSEVKDSVWKAYYHTRYALVIAASNYKNNWSSLPGAAKDADTIAFTLKQHGFEVMMLRDPRDSATLFKSLRNILTKAAKDANNCLLIYYAGHGYADEENAYLVMTDTSSSSRRGLLNMQSLFELVAKERFPKHVLIVLDACFSGKASKYAIYGASDDLPPLIEAKLKTPARYLLTSATSIQQVPDKSIFCRYFISGINGAADAFGGDGFVTLTELKAYMENKVTNASLGKQIVYMGQLLTMEQLRSADQAYGEFIFENLKAR